MVNRTVVGALLGLLAGVLLWFVAPVWTPLAGVVAGGAVGLRARAGDAPGLVGARAAALCGGALLAVAVVLLSLGHVPVLGGLGGVAFGTYAALVAVAFLPVFVVGGVVGGLAGGSVAALRLRRAS